MKKQVCLKKSRACGIPQTEVGTKPFFASKWCVKNFGTQFRLRASRTVAGGRCGRRRGGNHLCRGGGRAHLCHPRRFSVPQGVRRQALEHSRRRVGERSFSHKAIHVPGLASQALAL